MKMAYRRDPRDVLTGFFLLSHPMPLLFHTLAVSLFTLIAAWPIHEWSLVLLAIAAHTAMQLSINFMNDFCDRDLDSQSKRTKAIPRGLVKPGEALTAGLIMIALMLLLLLPLNRLALLISLAYLILGQGYNLGLKSTPLSGVVFALAIPLIPLYAFIAVNHPLPFLLWLLPVGFCLGVALNLGNSLPDLEEDAANGARTLAVTLGLKGSFLVCRVLLLLGTLIVALLTITQQVRANPWIIWGCLIVTLLLELMLGVHFGPAQAATTRKTFFVLVVSVCLLLAGGWFIGVLL